MDAGDPVKPWTSRTPIARTPVLSGCGGSASGAVGWWWEGASAMGRILPQAPLIVRVDCQGWIVRATVRVRPRQVPLGCARDGVRRRARPRARGGRGALLVPQVDRARAVAEAGV